MTRGWWRNHPRVVVSGDRGTFWKESWNQESATGVGPSVRTDPAIEGLRTEGSIMRKLLLAVLSIALMTSIAAADDKKGGGGGGGGDKAGKVKVYDFSGDTIEGDLVKPEGSTVDARDFAKHSSLITIRKDFIPEIIKSAEDL
jgi:hypothetical protein